MLFSVNLNHQNGVDLQILSPAYEASSIHAMLAASVAQDTPSGLQRLWAYVEQRCVAAAAQLTGTSSVVVVGDGTSTSNGSEAATTSEEDEQAASKGLPSRGFVATPFVQELMRAVFLVATRDAPGGGGGGTLQLTPMLGGHDPVPLARALRVLAVSGNGGTSEVPTACQRAVAFLLSSAEVSSALAPTLHADMRLPALEDANADEADSRTATLALFMCAQADSTGSSMSLIHLLRRVIGMVRDFLARHAAPDAPSVTAAEGAHIAYLLSWLSECCAHTGLKWRIAAVLADPLMKLLLPRDMAAVGGGAGSSTGGDGASNKTLTSRLTQRVAVSATTLVINLTNVCPMTASIVGAHISAALDDATRLSLDMSTPTKEWLRVLAHQQNMVTIVVHLPPAHGISADVARNAAAFEKHATKHDTGSETASSAMRSSMLRGGEEAGVSDDNNGEGGGGSGAKSDLGKRLEKAWDEATWDEHHHDLTYLEGRKLTFTCGKRYGHARVCQW